MTTRPTPVLKIGPILLVSIQTELTDADTTELRSAILDRIKKTGSAALLIDVTAVRVIDTFIARVLADTARMAQIMHARVVLVGMHPSIAMTLTEMGMRMPGISTALDLDSGLEALGYRLTPTRGAGTQETTASRSRPEGVKHAEA